MAKNANSTQSSKVHFPQVEHECPLVEGRPNLPHGSLHPRLGSGQGMTLKEILRFSVEASQRVNAYPDNHSTSGLGCHLEIVTKHRLAHGISRASRPTWEQPVPHCLAASVPRHTNYRQERWSKCLHAVRCLFPPPLLNHSFVPSFQHRSSPHGHFVRTIHRVMPMGPGQSAQLLAEPWSQLEWGIFDFHIFYFFFFKKKHILPSTEQHRNSTEYKLLSSSN